MKILGVDPGYDRLGAAVLEKTVRAERLIFSTCLVTDRRQTFAERLLFLGNELEKICRRFEPRVLAIEKLFFQANRKTANRVEATRGMITYLAARRQMKVVELAPAVAKADLTGYGRASKKQMAMMLPRIIKLPPPRGPAGSRDDEYDAIAIALAASRRLN